MNEPQANHRCGQDVRYNPSHFRCLPPKNCVSNLHGNSKSNMAAIVSKGFWFNAACQKVHLFRVSGKNGARFNERALQHNSVTKSITQQHRVLSKLKVLTTM